MPVLKYFSLKRTQELVVTVGTWCVCTEGSSNIKIAGATKAALMRRTWQQQGRLLPWGCWGPSQPELYNPEENLPESYFTLTLSVSNAYASTKPSSAAHQSRKHPLPV